MAVAADLGLLAVAALLLLVCVLLRVVVVVAVVCAVGEAWFAAQSIVRCS